MKKNALFVFLLILMFLSTACSTPKNQIMRAADWEKKHPDVYASFLRNEEMESTTFGGSEPIDYLEKYPNLKTFYDGYGFSKEYLRARGHVYALDDVINTARPKPGASCLSCKTSDFIQLLEKDGVEVNSINFDEFVAEQGQMEGVSCYDCHRNEPGTVNITREHLNVGLEYLDQEFKPGNMACGQCHVEYYLDPQTKEVILPWHNGTGTDGMLEYYDEIGFADWEHPTTGTKMLKAQHPEFETFMGSIHDKAGLSCISCHMPQVEGEKGDKFMAHQWTSPLKTVEQSCLTCHGNETADSMILKVEGIQGKIEDKTNEVSDVILQLIQELTKAVQSGSHTDAEIEQVRDLHRKAQFKWDFVFVENGEGFHNPDLAHKNLDEALALAKKGLEILK